MSIRNQLSRVTAATYSNQQSTSNAGKLVRRAFALGALLAAGMSPPYAHADVLPGISGHAWHAGEQVCFHSVWAAVQNSCTTTKKYLIPGTVRTSNTNVQFGVRAYGTPPFGYVQCRAVINDGSNGLINQTAFKTTSVSGWQTLVLGTLYLPTSATVHFDCDVSGNDSAKIANVYFTQ